MLQQVLLWVLRMPHKSRAYGFWPNLDAWGRTVNRCIFTKVGLAHHTHTLGCADGTTTSKTLDEVPFFLPFIPLLEERPTRANTDPDPDPQTHTQTESGRQREGQSSYDRLPITILHR